MPRQEIEDLKRIHLFIYERDHERLHTFFAHNIGVSKAVRQIIHNYLNQVEAKAYRTAKHPEINDGEVSFDPSPTGLPE